MNELDKVGEILNLENINLLALKNTGIARGIYDEFAESPMGDIDILISRLISRTCICIRWNIL